MVVLIAALYMPGPRCPNSMHVQRCRCARGPAECEAFHSRPCDELVCSQHKQVAVLLHRLSPDLPLLVIPKIVTGAHWTGSPNKSIDQIGKNCPKNVRKLSFQPLETIFGHFSDIFSTFFGHFVDIPFLWAVQTICPLQPKNARKACQKKRILLGKRQNQRSGNDKKTCKSRVQEAIRVR